jgi:hypothetical protein
MKQKPSRRGNEFPVSRIRQRMYRAPRDTRRNENNPPTNCLDLNEAQDQPLENPQTGSAERAAPLKLPFAQLGYCTDSELKYECEFNAQYVEGQS